MINLIDWYGEYLFKGFNTDKMSVVLFNLIGGFIVTTTSYNAVSNIINAIW